jgi:uncharacterized membrane protein
LIFVQIGCTITQICNHPFFFQEEDMTEQPITSDITSDDKLWAALGYPIFIIAIVMLLMEDKKKRPFIKYHAVQAIAVNIVFAVVMVVLSILVSILAAITLGFGGLLGCIIPVLWLVLLWPAILAYQGKYVVVPVITDFLKKQNWI